MHDGGLQCGQRSPKRLRPAKRNMIKRSNTQRSNLTNDIILLHSRRLNEFAMALENIDKIKGELVQRGKNWQEIKRQFTDLQRVMQEVSKGETEESQCDVPGFRVRRQELFKQLESEKLAIENQEKYIEMIISDEARMTYLLDAIPFLNVQHALTSDLIAAQRNDDIPEDCCSQKQIQKDLRMNTHVYTTKFYPALVRDSDVQFDVVMEDPYTCKHCGGQVEEVENSICVCTNEQCGIVAQVGFSLRDPTNNLNWEQLRDTPSRQYTYRRLNHFREYLRQIQGKSRATLPSELFVELREEFRKSRIPQKKITPERVKSKLKKIDKSKYYEHRETITQQLNPLYKPIVIDPTHEEKLCLMFVQLETPFEEIKHLVRKARKNFMSYVFVYYKLNELNGWDEYNRNSSLLKSVQLINRQDEWWKLVMNKLGWEIIGRTFDVHRLIN
jgi:hypothetical protein